MRLGPMAWDRLPGRRVVLTELRVTDDGADKYIKAFAQRLRQLRDQTGIPYNQVALKAGLDRQYLSRMVNAKSRPPSSQMVARIALAFDADPDDLCVIAGKPPADVLEWIMESGENVRVVRKVSGLTVPSRATDNSGQEAK